LIDVNKPAARENESQMRNAQKGFSLIELLIVVAIILIIAAIAIPNFLHSKMAANQSSAVGSMRSLNTACVSYSTNYGQFPSALTNLGPVASGTAPSSTSSDLIDSVLASGSKSGYTFAYTAGASAQSYSITATPIMPASSGQNMYFTDQSGVIRVDTSGAGATAASTPIG
jgi:prepilin-type N-terminal cleavage/methylation domain-containing protein